MRPIFFLLLTLTVTASATGRDLTLDEAMTLAINHSHIQKRDQAVTQALAEFVAASTAARLPTLSVVAKASYMNKLLSLPESLSPDGQSSLEIGSKDTYQNEIRLDWPLFTGGRVGGSIQAAHASYAQQQAVGRMNLEGIYLRTRRLYLQLIKAEKLRQAAHASLRRTAIIKSDVKSRHAAGVADSVDLLEADLAHTRATFALKEIDIGVRELEITLATQLGLRVSERITLVDSLPEPAVAIIAPQTNLSRPELDAADATLSLYRAELTQARADYFPTLAATAGYSFGKPDYNFFDDQWNDHFSLGARLTWTFNLGHQVGRLASVASYQLEAAHHARNLIAESLSERARLSFEKMILALERYQSATQEYALAERNYRLAEARHREGALSANRLLEIETALSASQASASATQIDFFIAQSDYFFAIGAEELKKGL